MDNDVLNIETGMCNPITDNFYELQKQITSLEEQQRIQAQKIEVLQTENNDLFNKYNHLEIQQKSTVMIIENLEEKIDYMMQYGRTTQLLFSDKQNSHRYYNTIAYFNNDTFITVRINNWYDKGKITRENDNVIYFTLKSSVSGKKQKYLLNKNTQNITELS